MLTIQTPDVELYDEVNNEFIYVKGQTLKLEHSLISISKWEEKWHQPFFSRDNKSAEQTLDYIKCMTITQNVKPEVYSYLSPENIDEIKKYIDDPRSATTFHDDGKKGSSREIITSELIYYWMVSYRIPPEYQTWHINRLLNLIKICDVKNAPPKKMSRNQQYSRNAALNKARRQKMNSRG